MKNKILIITMFALLFTVSANTQTINGHVFTSENGKIVSIEGVSVFFPQTGNGTITAADGSFEIIRTEKDPLQLVFSYVGFAADTVTLSGGNQHLMIELKKPIELAETGVVGYQQGTFNSRITPLKTEVITKAGLQKLACCNLSESFENSATISVGFADAISGAKQVQLLGLSGLYSQMMAENIPTMRGLASTFGWSYTPGPWLESIQISKGASSVVNGYESISGQINLEMKKPDNTEPLYINLYSDHAGRYEANVTAATQVAKNLWTGLLLHGSTETQEHDANGDGFMDQPKLKLLNLYNRWYYAGDNGIQSRTGIKFLTETRNSGQTTEHIGSEPLSLLYQTNITNKNFAVENKTGLPVGTKEGQTIGFITNFTHHEENSEFGKKSFEGRQNSFYSNLLFSSSIGEEFVHKYTVGASFLFDKYNTSFLDSLPFNATSQTPVDRTEIIPGVFGEYTYSPLQKLTLVLGLRGDYNSQYGWLVTPRTNVKYDINDYIILRASAGRGFRTSNVISENIGLMASSRKFDIGSISDLDIESAWNYGGNVSFSIPIWDNRIMSFSVDYFHTEFQNQTVVDIERSRNDVFFYNLQGRSFADVWQADLSVTPFKGFDVYAAFRYNNTQVTYTDADGTNYQMEKALTSRYRGLVNLSYATNLRRWVFDFTAQINGPTRLPGLDGYNSELKESPAFPVFFAQITRNSKRFDVYVGAENIADYRQENPIVDYQTPFGKDFDSSMIWGPLMGRKLYAGVRIRIGELK